MLILISRNVTISVTKSTRNSLKEEVKTVLSTVLGFTFNRQEVAKHGFNTIRNTTRHMEMSAPESHIASDF